jgi:hypothetical protein
MHDFPAINGDNALPVLQAFIDFVRGDEVADISGPVRQTKTARGRRLVFEPETQKFPGAFRVSTAGPRSFVIGEGEVNGRIPFLDGRDLAGLREDGSAHPDGRPALQVEGEPEARRSWICLLVITPPENLFDEPLPGEEGLTITHRLALPIGVPYGLDEEGRGLRPIAQLSWNSDRTRVDRVRQILHFDQIYRAPRGEDPRPQWVAAG